MTIQTLNVPNSLSTSVLCLDDVFELCCFFFPSFKSELLLDLGMYILMAINKLWMIGSMYFSMATPASNTVLHFWKRAVLFERLRFTFRMWPCSALLFVWVGHILALKENRFRLILNTYLSTNAYLVPFTSEENCMANSYTKHRAIRVFICRCYVTSLQIYTNKTLLYLSCIRVSRNLSSEAASIQYASE